MSSPFDAWVGKVEIDGHAVQRLRRMRGLTPDSLAEKAAVGRSTVQKWEAAGVRQADVENVRKVAQALAVDLDELLTPEFRRRVVRPAGESRRRPQRAGPAGRADAPAPAFSRLHQLPADLGDFTGRGAEFAEIVGRLRGAGGRVGLSALRGMGGVGKTTLAVRVAHAVKDLFPDAQLFLDLRGVSERPVTPAEAMTRFIRDFHPDAADLPEAEDALLPLYRSAMSGRRALVVLDNAAGEAQVKSLIAGESNGFIVTSRNALLLDGVASVRVDVLPPEESLVLLRGAAGAKGTDEELHTVAALCGHLPLALRVAGDFVRGRAGWTVGRYILALERERLRWLRGQGRDVEAVLKLSSAELMRDDEDLATRWSDLADAPSDFAADYAAEIWGLGSDDHDVREGLSELVARSLVLFDESSSRYRLHDLMKPIAAGLFT